MRAARGGAKLYHLSWRANGDSFDVALAVNRVLAAGGRAWRLRAASGQLDAGDYLMELTASQCAAIASLGLKSAPWNAVPPHHAQSLNAAVPLLFAGTASRFPYYAYYALCLLRLGVVYKPCDGATLANGALDAANLLILPGGFSNWGIDNAESVQGADARVRDFLAQGGAAVGSCGGAYYLSMGRPGWTGTAHAKPLYTHEYLQSGVGVVTLEMRKGPLALGCPPTMEVPYYHGPIYDLVGPGIDVAATFRQLTLPGRFAIDNPLDRDKFDRDMAGNAAILLATGNRGRAVLFSSHPEMGDLIRKYISLDGYVRHYLTIRGFVTMRDTLRHYRVCDSPSFRLVQNAIDELMSMAPVKSTAVVSAKVIASARGDADIVALCRRQVDALPHFGAGDEGDLLRDIAARAAARIDPMSARVTTAMKHAGELPALGASWNHLAATIEDHIETAPTRTPAQQLMELELTVALVECWTRVAELDLALAGRA
jgi:CobB/CobQ-like glutamine amidotransferase domain